jgi:hypothetical protein
MARRIVLALLGCVACSEGALPEGGSGYFGSTAAMPQPSGDATVSATDSGGDDDDGESNDGSGDGADPSTSPADGSSGAPADGSESAPAVCGNDNLEDGEDCDGMSFGDMDCTALGFDDGVLSCDSECHIITDACFTCGDGEIALTEQCDGNNFAGETCASLGFAQGALQCVDGCSAIDTSGCTPLPTCGDGVRNGGEQCDGNDLGAASCVSLGFDMGAVSCNANCTLNSSQCADDIVNCGMMGDFCLFDENDLQSTCCPAGVGGNVFGICNVFVCV